MKDMVKGIQQKIDQIESEISIDQDIRTGKIINLN